MEFNRTHPLPSVIKVPKVGLNIRSQNVSIKLDFPETDAPTILRQEWHQCDGREKLSGKMVTTQMLCQLWPNQKIHGKNKYSHNPASVTHKVADHQLYHEWEGLAAITSTALHQLLAVGVEKHIMVCSKLKVNDYTKIFALSFCHISRSDKKIQSSCWQLFKNHS